MTSCVGDRDALLSEQVYLLTYLRDMRGVTLVTQQSRRDVEQNAPARLRQIERELKVIDEQVKGDL